MLGPKHIKKNYKLSINLVLLGIFILFSNRTIGQEFTNRLYPQDFNANFTDVWHLDDGSLVTGIVLDTNDLGILYSKLFFLKLDINGDISFESSFGDSEHPLVHNQSQHCFSDQGNMVVVTSTIQNDDYYVELLSISSDGGASSISQIASPYNVEGNESNEYIIPSFISVNQSGEFLFNGLLLHEETGNDAVVFKANSNGSEIWSYIINTEFRDDIHCVRPLNENVVFDYTEVHGSNLDWQWSENVTHLICLDSGGELLWDLDSESFSWEYMSLISEFVIDEENEQFIIVGSHAVNGIEIVQPSMIAVDFEGNLNWAKVFDTSSSILTSMTQVRKSLDHRFFGVYNDRIEVYDSILGESFSHTVSTVVNFDAFGEVNWERKFMHLNSTNNHHRITDLVITEDDQIKMCGNVKDNSAEWTPDIPRQQPWFIVTDICGCLSPGCDLNCQIDSGLEPIGDLPFTIGPNPISAGTIGIHFFETKLDNSTFEIYNIQGELLDRFNVSTSDVIYLYNIDHLAAGSYLITLKQNSEFIHSERFIKE